MSPLDFLAPIAGYFAVVGLTFLFFWKWGARRFSGLRIQNPGKSDRAQILRELRNTLFTILFSSAVPVVLGGLLQSGTSRIEPTLDGWASWQLIALFLGLLVLNDVWFYGMHRLLHTEWLFKRVHSVHHRSVDVSPFTSYSFHPLEAVLLTGWIIPTVLLVPIPLPLLGAVQVIGLLNNVNAHLGYELQPRWFLRVPPFSWLSSSTFHNLHHAQVTGNYGLMLRVWDRMFGTERAEYETRFLTRGGTAITEGAGSRSPVEERAVRISSPH